MTCVEWLLGRRLAASGLALGVAAVTETLARTVGSPQFIVAMFLLALATTVPLGFLPPVAAAATVTVASVLSLVVADTLTVAGIVAQLVVLFRIGAPFWGSGLTVPFVVLALAHPTGLVPVLLASLSPAAVWVGMARRARGEAQLHSDARQAIANTLVEHTARGERARIARELHDVVAHHISMIAVQAETARLTTPGMPAAGAQRLLEIGDTARAGLTEMRRLLGVLREDARAEVPERHPQPGLKQLNELIDVAREASGTATRLILSGPPVPLDPGVELAAYRIVQEALTNARRHAPQAAVDVELHYTVDTLRLRIRDNGPGPAAMSSGHGLPGMRERAAAVGGLLRTGTATGGGFLIEATFPVGAEVSG
jgi:signal transduction histidine kinase